MQLQTLLKNYSAHFRPTPICPKTALAHPHFPAHKTHIPMDGKAPQPALSIDIVISGGHPLNALQSSIGTPIFVDRASSGPQLSTITGISVDNLGFERALSTDPWVLVDKSIRNLGCPQASAHSWTDPIAKRSCPRKVAFWWTSGASADKIGCICTTFSAKML